MNYVSVLQALTAIAALAGQITPLVLQLRAAIESQDEAAIEDLLRRLQAVNDQLGAAP